MERGLVAFEKAQAGEVQRQELPQSALEYLQSIYKNPMQPDHVRMRAASLCLPFETPKLAVTGYIKHDVGFAGALERALVPSNAAMKLIELKRIDDAEEEKSPDL
jgi:hypothetical protein